ncbi:EAL domain-containing protein [Trinickia terrae]|uniref:EAL domain-containing protein n=1 Tax=Trinickia terrae TaxID=2571161 RepID=A0A4U1HIR2_9BURK|nr:EAL domain-containing protein [Trinickia terrae]TKC79204.1 EAL domain-containing protein [Trinickia terrae]
MTRYRLLSTIKSRIIFALGIGAVTTITIGLFGTFSVSRMSTDVHGMYSENTVQLAKLSNVTIALLNSRATLRRLQATRLAADVERFAPGIRADLDMADREWASYYPADVHDGRERELAGRLDALIAQNRRYADQAVAAFTASNFDAAAAALNGGAEVAAALTWVLREDVALRLQQAKAASDESTSTASRISAISVVLVVVNLLIAAAVSVAILRSILGPLKRAVGMANNIASGKLENRLTVDSRDEIGQLFAAMKKMERQLRQMIYHDPLTSLPNRVLFNERLKQTVAGPADPDALLGVMMIDMDRFKGVNDTMGHAAGDELLSEAAERLTVCIRPGDTVARLGGDEFAVLLPNVQDRRILDDIARRIIARFDERFALNGREVFVTCSIGISLYPVDSIEPDDLLKYADSAMYLAKRSGRRGFRYYSKELTEDAAKRLALESELRRAVERGELELHYQPKVSFPHHEVVGSEALLRWRRAGVGLVPPNDFIPVAEETGLIVDMGNWVLREACRAAAEWNAGGEALHKVSVNLSARQFESHDLVSVVGAILDETGCRPEWLELEITESLLLEEDGAILTTLSAFRAMGLSIAIDDFGTGYSSLSYLARFPIDTLKIDKSFVQKAATDRRHAELVKAILSIARCLGQEVVAEGVETAEQAVFLRQNGCQVAQGFLFSRPLPKPDMASLPRRFAPAEPSELASR